MENANYARHQFDAELQELEHDLLQMGSRADAMVAMAVDSLHRLDSAEAMEVMARDDEIDRREIEIENRCIRLLALQQPLASDLRVIGTALKMITDIERVADLALDIAKIGMKIEKEFGTSDFIDFLRMANVARGMFREALEAFVRRDMAMVEHVWNEDDIVDDLYRELRGQIHEHMRHNPDDVVFASWMLLAIHHIERIADHSVNIAERVAFTITGTTQPLKMAHIEAASEAVEHPAGPES